MRVALMMTAVFINIVPRIQALRIPKQLLRSLTTSMTTTATRQLHPHNIASEQNHRSRRLPVHCNCNSVVNDCHGNDETTFPYGSACTATCSAKLYLPHQQSQQESPITTVMAPMVSASDYPFRCLVRQYAISTKSHSSCSSSAVSTAVPLVFTQMLHATNLVRDKTFFRNHYDIFECHDNNIDTIQNDLTESQRNLYNDDNFPTIDRLYNAPCTAATRGPVIAQLAGDDVATVVKAAQKIVASTKGQIAGIDLNLGCPQNIARKGNYGAYLMENHPSTACRILKALRDALPSTIAVSAKIRLPYHPAQQKDRLQQLCDTGINFITIHGRDYTENKTTVKYIQLHRLMDAVNTINEYSKNQIPVIVNGGIEFVSDAIQIHQITGAAAIMSSEALLERPNLLGEIQLHLHQRELLLQRQQQSSVISSTDHELSTAITTTPKEQFDNQIKFALDYIRWCYYVPPLSSGLGVKGGSFNVVRGHLFKMLYRYFNDPMNYDLRDHLGNGNDMQQLHQAELLVHTLHGRYESYTDMEWELLQSSHFPESTWYRRHRSSSTFIHERIKPVAHHDSDSSDEQAVHDTPLSIDERKMTIRKNIERLRMQKKQTL